MSGELEYYIITLLAYGAISVIAAWGLDLQFGDNGILNFGYVVAMGIGAYTVAILSLGAPEAGGLTLTQEYVWGASLPFPLPLLAAPVSGAVILTPIGWIVLRRLRTDYQAIALLSTSLIATAVVVTTPGLLGGAHGLHSIPNPMTGLGLTGQGAKWGYLGVCVVAMAACGFVVWRIGRSPLGRTMRAVRDNEPAASALGIDTHGLRMRTYAAGNAMGALSGALLAQYIGSWSTNDWTYAETFILLGAVIVGGAGSKLGVLLGALLLPVVVAEGVRLLPQVGRAGLTSALQYVLIGGAILAFMWFRPGGLLPPRRHTFPAPRVSDARSTRGQLDAPVPAAKR